MSGRTASGSATATGRGTLIGPSTLRGAANGVATSQTCVAFSGRAILKGRVGSIKLAARGARACDSSGTVVAFSGSATVTGGTARFAGARGTLSFSGKYVRRTGSVTIAFRGRLRY
jgi:hypothetical protein